MDPDPPAADASSTGASDAAPTPTAPRPASTPLPPVVLVNKPLGLTPLQAILRVRERLGVPADARTSYAGRLDPMARGLLVMLVGEGTKQQRSFELHTKEYRFEALFGLETDSYDVLGLCSTDAAQVAAVPSDFEDRVRQYIEKLRGKFTQTFPPYSAVRVGGRPLFQYAREGKLGTITVPEVEVEITSIEMTAVRYIRTDALLEVILEKLGTLSGGDFRQDAIISRWNQVLGSAELRDTSFPVVSCVASVTPGTYIRSIVRTMGRSLGLGATAFDIFRTKVGEFDVADAVET